MRIVKFSKYVKIVFSGLVVLSLLSSCSGETFETAVNDYNDASHKPQVSSLIASNNTTLSLSFDVNLDGNSARNAKYSITDQNGAPLAISSIQTGEKSIILTTDSQQNQNYTIQITGVKSANTVEMAPYSGNFSGDALPEIVNATSDSNDGAFYLGDEILIQVEFSEPVDVTGVPTLLMNTGITDSTAIYTSGSGTNILTFSYIVASGDSSSNLDYSDTNSLSLTGGTIIDLQQNNAAFSLPVPGEIGSLSYNKSFSINSTEFSISDVAVNEGDGSAIVTIAKTGASPGGTTIDYTTSDNTAIAPSDYTALSGTLGWSATETGNKTITITVINDFVAETDEAFTVTLSNPVNATIKNSTAIVTINGNDNVAPALSSVSITSDYTPNSLANVGNIVTVSFTSNEPIQTPTATIDGNPATIGGSDPNYTASYTLQTGDTEGILTFTIDFTDLAGNAGTQVTAVTDGTSVTFDKTAPGLAITAPTALSNVDGTKVITFTDTEPTNPQVSVDNVNWTNATSGTTTLSAIPQFAGLGEGGFTLYLRDIDGAGNMGSNSITLTKDTTAPVVAITAPSAAAIVGGTEVITFTDTESTNPQVSVDNINWTNATSGTTTLSAIPEFTGLGEAGFTLYIRDIDGAGNTGSNSITLTKDTTAPVVAITAPAATAAVDGTEIIIFTDTESTNPQVSVDNINWTNATSGTTTLSAIPEFAGLGEAGFTLYIRDIDGVGNTGSNSIALTKDTTAPVVAITAPSAAATVNGTKVITFTDTEPTNPQVSVDNINWTNATSGTTTLSAIPEFAGLGEAGFTLYIRDIDGVGNTGSNSIALTKDTTAPVVAITAPSAAATVNGTKVITFTDTEPTNPQVSVDNINWTNATSGTTTLSAIPEFAGLGEAGFTLYLRDIDGAGNTGSNSITLTKDSIAPVVAITAPSALSSVDGTEVITFTDTESTNPQVSVDNINWTNATSGTTTLSAIPEFAGLGEAGFTLYLRDIDSTGNTGSNSITLTKDTTAPVVAITAPAAAATVNGTEVITFTDTESTNPQVSVDNINWTNATSGTTTLSTIPEFAGLGEAGFTLYLRDIDGAGNTGSNSITLTKDSIAPVVAITAPSALSSVDGTEVITFTDTESTNPQVSVDNINWTNATSGTTTLSAIPEFAGLGEAGFTLYLRDIDSTGNTGSNSITLTKDTTAPVVAITAPAAAATVNGTKVIAFTNTEPTNPQVSVDNINWTNATSGTTTLSAIPEFAGLGEAGFTLYLRDIDSTGNTGSNSISLTKDTTAPSVVITAPPVAFSVNGSAIISFTDDDITNPQVSVDNTNWTNATSGTTTLSTIPEFVGLGDGAITLYLRDMDAAGNTGTDSIPLTKDTTAPALSPVGIVSDYTPNSLANVGNIATISFTSDEAIQSPTATIDGNPATIGGSDPNYTASYTLQTGDTEGLLTFTINFTDLAGNAGTQVTSVTNGTSVTFDENAPSTLPAPSGGRYSAASTVTLACSDNLGSGCATIYYTTDGTTPTTASAVYSAAITTSATGVTALKFFAVDNIGNSETVTTQMYATGNDYLLDAGMHHSVAHKKSDNTVWTWGDNSLGSLGNGDNPSIDSNTPTQVCDSGEIAPCSIFLTNVSAIGSGHLFSVTLKNDGSLWTWGQNDNGQLGDNTITQSNTPTQVVGPGGTGFLANVFAFAGGNDHTLAVQTDGSVWAWGNNVNGQLGDNTITQSNTPVQVTGSGGIGVLADVVAVAAGEGHSVALKADGTVWTWGQNTYGQLGDDNAGTNSSTPVQVCATGQVFPCPSFLTNVVAIAAGSIHSVALKADGTVWAWGDNTYGQLGDGSATQRNTPVQAGSLISMTAIAAEMEHTLALKSDGTAWAWGNNAYGQIGNGARTRFSMSIFSGSNPNGLEYDPVSNTMWVADFGNNTIYNLNTNGTVISSFSGPGANPRGIAFDGTNLWIADITNPGTIYEVNTSGVVLSSFVTSGFDNVVNETRTITYDSSDGSLWVIDHNGGSLAVIYNITTAGVLVSSFSLASNNMLQGISYDSGTDSLWLINHTSRIIYNVDTTGTIISQFLITGFDASATLTWGVAFDTNTGTLWVVDENSRKFYNITTAGALIQTTPRSNPNGLDYDPASDTMWVADFGNNTIYNIRTDGAVISSFSGPGANPRGIAFDGTNLWIADTTNPGTIYNVNTSGAVLSSFLTSGFDSGNDDTRSIAYDTSDGSLWVTDHNSTILSTVYNVTTAGVLQSMFSLASKNMIQGISYDAGTDTLWLIDHFSNTIYNVDTAGAILSQFQTTVYDANANITRDVAFDTNTGTLWVVDENVGKFYNITTTGSLNLATLPSQVCATGQTYPCSSYLANIIAIGAGHRHILALDSLNQFRAWGDNSNGQLGDNSTTDRSIPVAVPVF